MTWFWGKADKLFWLTDYLVRHGVIVIATDHPGNMTGESSADGMMRVWARPKDLIFALDQLLQQSDFKNHLEITRLAATGHSAGGTTALLLAGASLSSNRFISPIPLCEAKTWRVTRVGRDHDIRWFAEPFLNLKHHAISSMAVEATYLATLEPLFAGHAPGYNGDR
ncbi:MAG: alpha/beta fold hydrolase [Proteobacteria bacterium]|nr:alpha/beta fold hydrolase [Pseudomonadota bacterium]